MDKPSLVIALPKGRILSEARPLLAQVGIVPEHAFDDEESRQLSFSTNIKSISLIRVRSFDVATFVAFGAAQIGIAGNDVLAEFNYADIYSPIDLEIGKCRLSLARQRTDECVLSFNQSSHVRVATKYPELTKRYYGAKGIQAECIKLNGAMELAPRLNLAPEIVDLVSSGRTLLENNLIEVETILEVSSRLVVNRNALKVYFSEINSWIESFRTAVDAKRS
jgi:ATP phosphoribosyltransferase